MQIKKYVDVTNLTKLTYAKEHNLKPYHKKALHVTCKLLSCGLHGLSLRWGFEMKVFLKSQMFDLTTQTELTYFSQTKNV